MSRTQGRGQGQPGSSGGNHHDPNGASLEMHQGRGLFDRSSSDGHMPRGFRARTDEDVGQRKRRHPEDLGHGHCGEGGGGTHARPVDGGGRGHHGGGGGGSRGAGARGGRGGSVGRLASTLDDHTRPHHRDGGGSGEHHHHTHTHRDDNRRRHSDPTGARDTQPHNHHHHHHHHQHTHTHHHSRGHGSYDRGRSSHSRCHSHHGGGGGGDGGRGWDGDGEPLAQQLPASTAIDSNSFRRWSSYTHMSYSTYGTHRPRGAAFMHIVQQTHARTHTTHYTPTQPPFRPYGRGRGYERGRGRGADRGGGGGSARGGGYGGSLGAASGVLISKTRNKWPLRRVWQSCVDEEVDGGGDAGGGGDTHAKTSQGHEASAVHGEAAHHTDTPPPSASDSTHTQRGTGTHTTQTPLKQHYRPSRPAERAAGQEGNSDTSSSRPFRVVSWNILASSLVDFSYLPYCTEQDVEWDVRRPRILDTIKALKPDLLCLQEDDQHDDMVEGVGPEFGSVFKKRTGIDKKDGCAVFWRKDRFSLVEAVEVEYFRPGFSHLDRDNVGVIAMLREHGSGRHVLCATTHILFNPSRGDVKLAQVQVMLRQLKVLLSEYPPDTGVILCGDFNATPCSAIYEFLNRGSLDVNMLSRYRVGRTCHLDHATRMMPFKDALTRRPRGSGQRTRRRNDVMDGDDDDGSGSDIIVDDSGSEADTRGRRTTVGHRGGTGGGRGAHVECGGGGEERSRRGVDEGGSDVDMNTSSDTSPPSESAQARNVHIRFENSDDERKSGEDTGGGGGGGGDGDADGSGVDVQQDDDDEDEGGVGVRHLGAGTCVGRFNVGRSCYKPGHDPSFPRENHEEVDTSSGVGSATDRRRRSSCVPDDIVDEHLGTGMVADAKDRSYAEGKGEDASHTGGFGGSTPFVPPVIWSFPKEYGSTGNPPVAHNLKLQSAYAQRPDEWTTGEPAFTAFHGEFKGTVDYIWFGRDGLRCTGVLSMPLLRELRAQVGLPCRACPSDHLPLVAEFLPT